MFKSGSSGLALLLTILSLLAFVFIAFMGLEYLLEGNHWLALLICLAGAGLLGLCIWLACWGKSTREKHKGFAIEIISLLVAAVLLYLGRTPFTQFMYVVDHKQDINNLVMAARDNASRIDTAYLDYANQRLKDYEKVLKKGKDTDGHAVNMKVKSLTRRLLPDELESLRDERKAWLDELQQVNVWNLSTAKNLNHIITASDDWIGQYATVSSLIYEGETCEPFAMTSDDIKSQYEVFTTPREANWTSTIAMLVCCVLILTYYIQCLRAKNKYQGHRA